MDTIKNDWKTVNSTKLVSTKMNGRK